MENNQRELLERVKAYNDERKKAESESAKLSAHVTYAEQDLSRLCKELTELMGIEINKDNVDDILKKEREKILNDLEVGEEILNRIKEGKDLDDIATDQGLGRVVVDGDILDSRGYEENEGTDVEDEVAVGVDIGEQKSSEGDEFSSLDGDTSDTSGNSDNVIDKLLGDNSSGINVFNI